MNKKALSPLVSVVLLLTLLSPRSGASPNKVISDSLVENLACSRVSTDEIYRRIRPEAFSSQYHNLSVNWPFATKLYDLAACWSLARTQRLFFYLARWNHPQDSARVSDILDMVRGSRPYLTKYLKRIEESPVTDFKVFTQKDPTWKNTSPLWAGLQYGYTQNLGAGKSLYRSWKGDIEQYQKERFHEFAKNLKLVIGDDARSAKKNRLTRNQILNNLESHRMTLLILRPTRMSQHVVIAKSFRLLSNGRTEIVVYDSNQPLRDQILTYDASQEDFFAPEIVRGLAKVKDPQAALGVFVVDEYDRSLIETALMKYYKSQCL